MAGEILQPPSASQYSYQVIKTFSAGDEIKQLLRSQRAPVVRRIVDYHSAALKHVKDRVWQKNGRGASTIQPDALYSSAVGTPANFESCLSSSVTTKYIKMMHNKVKSPIFCAQWDPDGRRLVTGAASGEYTLWNAINFSFEALLQAHDAPIRSMSWSHGHEWLISSDDRGFIKYWQSNMNNVHTFQAHSDPVRCHSLSPNDSKLVTGSDDGTVRIWDFNTCNEEFILRGNGADVKCIDWHPSKALIVSGSKDNQQPVKLWDPKAGQGISTLHLHKGAVQDVKWNANGNWMITASRDNLIKVLDIRAMKEMYVLRGHRRDVNTLEWHPVHECMFASGGSDGAIYFWIVGNVRDVGCIETAHDNFIWDLDWHPLGHVLCSASNDHTCKLWTRNKPGDEMTDKYNTSSHFAAGESTEHEISSAGLPGIGYAKHQQQQNTSITLPPPSKVHQQSDIGVTDSRDVGIKIESGAISVPVLGKDLVLTEKDLINIANTISSTNRDTSHEVALHPPPNAQQQPPPQQALANLPPFEPRRNFNQGAGDVPWETNYPPRPPPHGDWNQPPIGPPRMDGREEFNRPPPKDWAEFPPPPEFRRFHGRPGEWVHPSRRPEGGWGFDQQRDRRWKGVMPGPHEFRRDFPRGDRDHGGGRDFPPEQFDNRRMQDGGERVFHRSDDRNRPNDGGKFDGPSTRDPYRWERGDQSQPNWGSQEQFDGRAQNSSQTQRPPFPDQQQQQHGREEDSGRHQHTAVENQQGLDPSKGPVRPPTDIAKGPIHQQQFGGPGSQDQSRASVSLNQQPNQPPQQFDAGRSINQGQGPPNQPPISGSLQGIPPVHQMPGQQGPPTRGLPNQQHVRDPRMEGLQGGPPKQPNFPDDHKQNLPMNRPPGADRPFDRSEGPPQVMPPGPGGAQPQQPPRGPRNREAAWLQDTNHAQRGGPRNNVSLGQQQPTRIPRSQDNSFPTNMTFPPPDVPPPNLPFDPTKGPPPPFMPNQPPPPFRNQEQMPPHSEGLPRPHMHPIPNQEPSIRGHPPEAQSLMDVPKRQDQFLQKGLKQHDSTAPPWSAAATKPVEQPGGVFNDQPTNQQLQNILNARTLLPTPQDGGSPTSVSNEGFQKPVQGPPFGEKGPGQLMDPRMQNARQDIGFDPRMGSNMNQRGQQQQPPQGDMSMMMPPDRRPHDFRKEGGMRPMGQNFDPRMRPGREETGHPPSQDFQTTRERQEPPWSGGGGGGIDRGGQSLDFQDDKRRTLLPPPIMLHKDEETNNHPSGRQGEFPDDNRRRDQRFDDYRGEKQWHGRPDYDRGRRDLQREPRRSPPRRNSAGDRPPAKRPRRDKELSSRHAGDRDRERNNDKEKDRKPERSRGNDKLKSNDRSGEKNVGTEKPKNP